MSKENQDYVAHQSDTFKWYAVHAHSGQEKQAGESLKKRIIQSTYQDKFGEVLVPISIINKPGGKQQKKVLMPGYIIVQMELSDETMQLVVGTQKIRGFVGTSAINRQPPNPLRAAEVARLTSGESTPIQTTLLSFEVGEQVKVIGGPFANFTGTIDEVVSEHKIKVSVSIFGRPTLVELDYTQVDKLA